MWIVVMLFVIYVIARKMDWKISEWLEIVLAAVCLFFLFRS